MELTGKHIVLGITGGIAAYKSAEIVSRLRHLGANVHVIMTRNATEFITPLTFQTLSANQVVTDTFQAPEYWNVEFLDPDGHYHHWKSEFDGGRILPKSENDK